MRSHLTILLTVIAMTGCTTQMYPPDGPAYEPLHGWVVTADQALAAHATGATFLDTRKASAFAAGHVAGAHNVTWQQFSEPGAADRGRLLADDSKLTALLRAAGVTMTRPVIVVGDAINGWGEDGRIVWMLRTLGHDQTALLDGGQYAASQAGIELTSAATPAGQGDFTVARDNSWDIQKEALQKIVKASAAGTVLVDTRELREFEGGVPYGEPRGGHLPGAVHLHYSSLLNTVGGLRDRQTLLARLKALGITSDREVIAYCTGGVRSGWFVAVLVDLGFKKVRNYAGSMWEWAAGPADQFPLE